jgi:hypothetical protein
VSLSHTGGDVLAGVLDASSIDGICGPTANPKQKHPPKLYQPPKQNGMFYE